VVGYAAPGTDTQRMEMTSVDWPTMVKFGIPAIVALLVVARLLLHG